MNQEYILSPEQFFYMGRLLQAKYIDYAYIAAMNDINHNFALFETEAKASLVSAGILMEDFGGNIEIDSHVLQLLKPVFFGKTETSIEEYLVGETNTINSYRLHFYDGVATMVTGDKGKLYIKATDQIEIRNKIDSLIDKNYSAENQAVDTIERNHITRLISFKHVSIGMISVVKTYIEADGIFYHESGDSIESVTRDQFVSDAFNVVKGD